MNEPFTVHSATARPARTRSGRAGSRRAAHHRAADRRRTPLKNSHLLPSICIVIIFTSIVARLPVISTPEAFTGVTVSQRVFRRVSCHLTVRSCRAQVITRNRTGYIGDHVTRKRPLNKPSHRMANTNLTVRLKKTPHLRGNNTSVVTTPVMGMRHQYRVQLASHVMAVRLMLFAIHLVT